MYRNYFKIAVRNLRRQAGFSLINIGGLGLGLACAFMIVLFVRYETTFDTFHEKGDRLFRLLTEYRRGENAGARQAIVAAGVAGEVRARYPEIASAILYDDRTPFLRVEGESRRVGSVAFMTPGVLEAFTFPLVRGDAGTAMADPYSILLTRTAAEGLFGQEDAIGRTVTYAASGGDFDVTVTGILDDIPANSHLRFSALLPIELMREFMGDNALEDFTNVNYYLYLLLAPGSTAEQLEAKLLDYQRDRSGDDVDAIGSWAYVLQPIPAIHLTTDVGWDVDGNVDPMYLLLFSGIAMLILVVAGVNFINLSTARATKRAREVGMRKAVGAQRRQLVSQFLGESVMLSALAVVLALGLTVLFLPAFRGVVGSSVSIGAAAGGGMVVLLVLIGLFAGILAGVYPAFYVSAFRPAAVLKGGAVGGGAVLLRKGLLVFQFCISIFLIVATLTIHRQLGHVRTLELGFDREHVVYAPMVPPVQSAYDAFRQSALEDPRILSVAQAGNVPGRVNTSRGYNWPGSTGDGEQGEGFYTVLADYDYLETVGLELVAGRDFSRERGTDFENAYILNETAAAEIGYARPEDAVGAPFRAWDREMGEIIGVVRDFHFQSLHQTIGPVVLNIKPWISYVAFRVAPGDFPGAVAHLTDAWARIAPGYPFEYRFLDEDFDRLYRADQDLGRLFTIFAAIALAVACLGLFGLSAYAAERRRKEMSIRKVLGASGLAVVSLISLEFLRLVVIGFVIATPAAWFAMQKWLDAFAYRIDLGPGIFLLAGVVTLFIAEATVSWQAMRAALVDPAAVLRNE